jgi:hypothetical protein
MGNGAVVDGFRATIANVRGFVKADTPFPDIISTGLITGGTGGALDVAENGLAACIGGEINFCNFQRVSCCLLIVEK